MLPRLQRRSFSFPRIRIRSMTTLPPSARPSNWKAFAPAPPPQSATFAGQSSLPKLPVPRLSDTLARLKDSLKPLAWNAEEYGAAERKIDEFAESAQAGVLQDRLLRRAEETPHWLEEWWDDGGYLGYRDSVVINVSYYYGFDDQPAHLPQTPAARAAAITRAGMVFRQQLKRGQAKPDATKEGPICMDTYRWMFDCSRVPGPQGLDWYVSYAKEGEMGDTGHVVVFRKNRVWKVDAFTKDGRLLSTSELEQQFQHIYKNTEQEYPGVGVLTANNRDIWAKDYIELTSDPTNANILRTIHSAAFAVALDASSPSDAIAHSRDLWHGAISGGTPTGLRNRWVDKPVQFIVFDNAKAGLMGEHAVMDGTPTVRLCDEVLDRLHDPSFDHGTPVSSSVTSLTPVPLDWNVSPTTERAIAEADKAAVSLIDTQTLSFHLTSYGKAAIKAFGVSPDSWAQMIVQLAYRRLLGGARRNGGTYEAATTRKFFKGRTEAIRVVTSEADVWAQAMDDASIDEKERKALFDTATRKHLQMAKSSGAGQGVDRHLFGLKKLIIEGEEMPAFFFDPLVQRSSHWVLSTSAIFSKHFPVYGWGEVVPDGFGVAYMTGYDDCLQYTITSRKEMPNQKFCDEIAKAAVDLYDLHEGLLSSQKSRL